jgi:hypothetical protein
VLLRLRRGGPNEARRVAVLNTSADSVSRGKSPLCDLGREERLEAVLARLYADDSARQAFLANPRSVGIAAMLSKEDCQALESIDREELLLATYSYAKKRAKRLTAKGGHAT